MTKLRSWLKELELEKYAEAFEREEIGFDVLPELTEHDLERIGLPLGPRRAVLRAIVAMAPDSRAATPRHQAALPTSVVVIIVIVVAAAILAGSSYWIKSRDAERMAEAEAALTAATRTTLDLDGERQKQNALLDRVKAAHLAEESARAKGDLEKVKVMQELTRKAESEAAKQAEVVRQRAAEAKVTEDAARLADEKKRFEMAKAAEQAAQQKAAQEKAAAEKAAQEKAAAEKAAKLAAASPLEQFMARNTQYRFLPRDPPGGTLPYLEIVFVNDDSCPKGEIKELTGGNNQIGVGRKSRCVKLSS